MLRDHSCHQGTGSREAQVRVRVSLLRAHSPSNKSRSDIILPGRKAPLHKVCKSSGNFCLKRAHVDSEQNQYQATSPPPNFQRPTPAPAPFYLQGAEVPAQGSQPPAQQYPPRDQPSRVAAGKQPAPLQTSSPPPQAYQAYSQPPAQAGQRPQSPYGNPQELPTQAYHSPVVTTHNPSQPNPYSASVYSQEDPYATSPTAPAPSVPSAPAPSAPSGPPQGVPTPLAIGPQSQYSAYNPQRQDSYDAQSQVPPQPSGPAPPIPQGAQAPPQVITPPPLHPGGPAFDARQSLPSQIPHPQQQQPPQYKAYVPPGNEPSAPQDFYRQNAAY